MKRLFFTMMMFLATLFAFAQYSGSGAGTESDPYRIYYADQLNQLRNFLNNKGVYFKLMDNIDLTDWIAENNPNEGWQPIGTESTPFKGILYGNGKTISNLMIDRKTYDKVGFFGTVSSATITDLTIKGRVTGQFDIGGLTGHALNSKLSKCKFVIDAGQTVSSTATNSNSTIGGLIGKCENSDITDCSVEGGVGSAITGCTQVGGLIGYDVSSSVTNCSTKAILNATGEKVGGICGEITITANDKCYSVTNCTSHCTVSGTDKVGGLFGTSSTDYESSSAVSNCRFYGNVSGHDDVGGLGGSVTLPNSYNIGDNSISNSYAIGNITGTGNNIGGLFGTANGTYCYEHHQEYYYQTISDCYYSGVVDGVQYVGGLIGNTKITTMSRCYSIASVYGAKQVGGLIGSVGERVTIKSNVAINSTVSATSEQVGRIYAAGSPAAGETGTAEENRALTTTKVKLNGAVLTLTDDAQSGTSTGISTLKYMANYVALGWDFKNNWSIQETECYPYKPWQTAPPIVTSKLESQQTVISGKSISGGTVFLEIGNSYKDSTVCKDNLWTFTVPAMQSGEEVRVYAVTENNDQSYIMTYNVKYPGSGTVKDPYKVYTADDLQGVFRKGYYQLMNDIDLTAWITKNSPTEGWPSIGRRGSEAVVFDGNNHKITGLWSNTKQDYCGLFSNFDTGTIKDLTVETADGKQVKGGNWTAILIGRLAHGGLQNCTVKGSACGTVRVGGVVGASLFNTLSKVNFSGVVESTVSDKDGTGDTEIGGLAASSKHDIINACLSDADINSVAQYIGGLVGSLNYGTLELCKSSGTVKGTRTGECYVGGLIGQNARGSVKDCYSTVEVNSSYMGAGLVAYNTGSVTKCYASGNIYSTNYAAGVVGKNDSANATISKCVASSKKVVVTTDNTQQVWSMRVLGNFSDEAPEPDKDNYALDEMQLSVNGVAKKVSDNIQDGYARTAAVLMTEVPYTTLGWDFSDNWTINAGKAYPTLRSENIVDNPDTATTDNSKYITELKSNVAIAQTLYDGATEGTKDGNYQVGSKASLLSVIKSVNARISDTMDKAVITQCTEEINNAVSYFKSQIISSGEATDPSVQTDNTLLVNNIETAPGVQATLTINMKNKDAISGYQFDLYLPTGITVAKDSDDELLIANGSRAAKTHIASGAKQSNGSIRVLTYSAKNATFSGNEGDIATITLNVPASLTDGDYTLYIKDVSLTNPAGDNINAPNITGKLSVKSFVPGDVNGDSKITVADISAAATFIMGNSKPNLIEKAADISGDGMVKVNDLAQIANIILYGNSKGEVTTISQSFMLKALKAETNDADKVEIIPFAIEAGEEKTVNINLTNPVHAVSGYQFDLVLPDGIEIEKDEESEYMVTNGSRLSKKHVLEAAAQKDGSIRFLAYSSSNKLFTGNSGDVAVMTLKAGTDLKAGVYMLKIKNISLTNDAGDDISVSEDSTSILSGNLNDKTQLALVGNYTLDALNAVNAKLADNHKVTSIDLTKASAIDETGTLATGNANTLIYVTEDMKTANTSNVVVGDNAGKLVLTDQMPFNAPKMFKATTAVFTKNVPKAGFYTLILPFAADLAEDVIVEEFVSDDANKMTADFSEVTSMQANIPYIIKTKGTEVSFAAFNATIAATPENLAKGDFEGVYNVTSGNDVEGKFALKTDGTGFEVCTQESSINPFSAILNISATGSKVAINHHFSDVTGAEKVYANPNSQDSLIYDSQGRRFQSIGKGTIYIKDGMKVRIK